ncbi:MAG TPA: amidohydrolase family protein [Pyrinomonadaceae bacterium]|nr:amidohydrolase family protein [Pyrinomonadaceae bacterium]
MTSSLRISLSLLLVVAASVVLGAKQNSHAAAEQRVTAFTNVNVIPFDRERVLTGQTVIVRDGRIAEIGAADKTKVPAGALQIDGNGKYLMPGLADMHVHLYPGTGQQDDLASQQFQMFLANGVTTIRNMIGKQEHVALRDRVAKGELLGPTIYTAGPPLLGNNVPTPEAAEKAVVDQKKAGYDLLKVHEGLSPETYAAIAATAKREGIPFAGHATATVGLKRVLDAQQNSIEHLDGYLQAMVADDAPVKPNPSQVVLGPVLQHIDESKLAALATATRKANVWNDPTLTLFKLVVSEAKPEDYLKWPEMQYIPAKMRENFAKQKQSTVNNPAPASERQRYLELRNKVLMALHAAGAKLLVGPDSPQFFLVPGFATHRELESFVQAGLSPYQALEAATRNPAEYFAETMKASRDFGTVEVGLRADLLLLDANPLQSVANLSKRAGVMVRGRWLPESELRKMLENIATLNRQDAAANTPQQAPATNQQSTAGTNQQGTGKFSGTWALDKANSEGLPPGMDQLMTVTQTGDKLSLETKLITEQGENVVPDTYVLDGKEVDFTPRTPGGGSGKGKRTAKLGADGNSIEVSETATFDTPEGAFNVKATRKWTLSPDGKTLKIEMTVDGPNGQQVIKRTFVKK